MSLLVAENLHLSFGPKQILDGTHFSLAPGERVGLVGANGTGKSSLLRILAGERKPDHGTISLRRHSRVAYLPQDIQESPQGHLLQTVLESAPEQRELELQTERIEEQLQGEEDEKELIRLSTELAEAHERLAQLNLQFSKHRAEQILAGLGFKVSEYSRPIAELSGGWRMRAALAGLLFAQPDILLLDEPTNHLDFASVRWLAKFLRLSKQALFLICHDREFLNQQVDQILSFEVEGLRSFRGNYDAYVKQRAEEEEVLLAAATNQERERRDAERFINRFRAQATKARAVQSRIKRLEKMDEIVTLKHRQRVRIRFPNVSPGGKVALTVEELSKSFGDNELYRDLTLQVRRHDRIVILGDNGVGKTTLLRILAQEIAADSGTIRLGHDFSFSYYAQHHADSLNHSNTILEEVGQHAGGWSATALRSVLGAFLFGDAEIDKSISVLSGGERARVALAKLLVRPANLLLIDEPTNHLDTESSEVLAEALEQFAGTVVFVSHNMGFVRRLATRIWDIRDHKVHVYPGTFGEYIDFLDRQERGPQTPAPKPEKTQNKRQAPSPKPARGGPQSYQQRKTEQARKRSKKRQKEQLTDRIRELEGRIAKFERRQKSLEAELAKKEIYADKKKYRAILADYEAAKDKLEQLMGRWESLTGQLE